MLYGHLFRGAFLEFAVFVDAFLYEYAFERGEVQQFALFAHLYLQFAAQDIACGFHTRAEDVAHAREHRLVVGNHAAVGRQRQFAVREGIQGVYCLVGRCSGLQIHDYQRGIGGVVVDRAQLYLALFAGLGYRLYERVGGEAERNLGNGKCLGVDFLDFGPHFHASAAAPVIVTAHVYQTAGGKVGIERKCLSPQTCHGGIKKLVEVMGQYQRRETCGDTACSLREQQGEFHRECHRFLLAAVVGGSPLGHLGVEQSVERERRKTCLDISAGGRGGSGEDVAPVTLGLHQEFLLSQLHERAVNRSVAVGVILHGVAHNVGNLVEASVVERLHRVEYATLHRLQTVLYVGDGAVKYGVGGIVEIPALEHAPEVLTHHVVVQVNKHGAEATLGGLGGILLFRVVALRSGIHYFIFVGVVGKSVFAHLVFREFNIPFRLPDSRG